MFLRARGYMCGQPQNYKSTRTLALGHEEIVQCAIAELVGNRLCTGRCLQRCCP